MFESPINDCPFFSGLNDSVQCSVCQIVLKDFKANDSNDPWIMHCKTNPGCAYLERTKGATWIQENK